MTSPPDWTHWLSQHGRALVLFARQYVPRQADAEDVVHDAFLAFWKVRQRVEDPQAYLYQCVRHQALNWLRAYRRRQLREEQHAQPEARDWFTSSDGNTELIHKLAMLPEEQREVVVMKTWGQLSFDQIGCALGISANTAASRYRYALEKLRASMTQEMSHD
jgi:RNA polymerase sigma-70 factor, ECF subfamily